MLKKWASILFLPTFLVTEKLCFNIENLDCLNQVQPFFLNELSFKSNINFDPKEFKALVDLNEGQLVDSDLLKNSCFYLKQKNKFKKICLNVSDTKSKSTKNLEFELISGWTFNSVSITGILIGKETYQQMYKLEHGDLFDPEKHKHSLQEIKRYLDRLGYMNSSIEQRFEKDSFNRSIKVFLNIKKNKRLWINSVNFILPNDDPEGFKKKINDNFAKKLSKKFFSDDLLDKVTESIKKFLALYGYPFSFITFKQTHETSNKIRLDIEVKTGKKQKIFFSGNRIFSNKRLSEYLDSIGLSSLNLPAIFLKEELIKFYRSYGFFNVNIEVIDKNDFCCFQITEKKKALIKKVEINGSSYFKQARLERCFQGLISKGFSDIELEKGISKVQVLYFEKGFLDFKCSHQLIEQGKDLNLLLLIHEGPQAIISGVEVDSNLCKKIHFKLGMPFLESSLSTQRKEILDLFISKKKSSFDIIPEIEVKEVGLKKEIFIAWKVKEKKSTEKFGKPIIFGSTNYDYSSLIKEVAFENGDSWDRDKLYETFLKLRSINAFETVRIYPGNEKDFFGLRPVFLKFYPANKYEVKTRFGFQQVSKNLTFRGQGTFKLGGSFLVNSPFFLGDQFSLDSDFTLFYRNFAVRYSWPIFNNFKNLGIVQAYNNKLQQPLFIGSKKNLYEVRQQGGFLSFERKEISFSRSLTVGLEKLKISKLSVEAAQAIHFSTDYINKSVPYFFVEPALFIDQLNDKINPTKGFFFVFSGKGMVSSEHSLDFCKLFLEHAFFCPLVGDLVLATRIRLGHIFIHDFQDLFPCERFFLGGPNSLRSYQPDLAPPLGTFKNEEDCEETAPIGGTTMWNLNLELRLPVYKNLGLTLFGDMGGLSNRFYEGKKSQFAVGFGVRYFTPVGPLRLDLGWNPASSLKDSNIRWYFTLGQSF